MRILLEDKLARKGKADSSRTAPSRARLFACESSRNTLQGLAARAAHRGHPMSRNVASDRRIAYFSMEIALDPRMHTYSGGLGILAGDFLKSCADLAAPVVAVSLVHHSGYFAQHIDQAGDQQEAAHPWNPAEFCRPLRRSASVTIEGRDVRIKGWRYEITGVTGATLPVLLLDTDVAGNAPQDRRLTDRLYGGDDAYRLAQEAILGIGGLHLLDELGYDAIDTYHMNEGHAALLVYALAEELRDGGRATAAAYKRALSEAREYTTFTTHTPVPAGHDRFDEALVARVLGRDAGVALARIAPFEDGMLNMTHLALAGSRYVNAVALKHAEVSAEMFPEAQIASITNGVHAATWLSAPFAELFDRHIPGWREDNDYIRYITTVGEGEILDAHAAAKRALLDELAARGTRFDPNVFTIGFARRATGYKRPSMLISDPRRLAKLAKRAGPVQIVYAGKAHPRDTEGKAHIKRIVQSIEQLGSDVSLVYLDEYDMRLGGLITAGVDLWLNNPRRPLEASGTSGMKAALNGVPSLSTLDGWWIEGYVDGVTGWAIEGDDDDSERASLYAALESRVLPLYYKDRGAYARVMRAAIALNGSYFNTQRMVQQYLRNAYAT